MKPGRASFLWLLAFAAAASAGSARAAFEPTSHALAGELMSQMADKHLQAVAARVPGTSDQFVAAMGFPNVQLLVVSARHATPELLAAQLAQKQFGDVYAELQQSTNRDSRIFFQDLGADGLGTDGGVDVMYDRGVQTLFDGDWKRAKLSRDAYEARLAAADKRYGELLEALLGALKAS